ncbi:MAG: hypothetical protein KKA81_08575 [Bacteroidetes bacterium]|nr:hypothetical protein [Bacteroidota bacterium]
MNLPVYRILIVEDTKERQKILKDLYKDHAWIMVHTAERAIRLLEVYQFDLISLDYDLAGIRKGDAVAEFIAKSKITNPKVIVHSMNSTGAQKIKLLLPDADVVPLSKMIRTNITFKRLREELKKATDINWAYVFSGKK